jgi:uncharacterized protein (TIGR03437 family)
VQVPTERVCIVPGGIPGTCDDSHPPLVVLNIEAKGQTGPDFPVRVTTSRARLLNSCDSIFGPPPPPAFPFQGCVTLATHADGSLIDNAHPAGLGEVITLYAVGFPWDAPSGDAIAEARPLKSAIGPVASFNFRMVMKDPEFGVQETVQKETLWRVEYIGAVAGHVGLFQVNLQIPPPTLSESAPVKLSRSCESGPNLSITLSNPGTNSAAICVQ